MRARIMDSLACLPIDGPVGTETLLVCERRVSSLVRKCSESAHPQIPWPSGLGVARIDHRTPVLVASPRQLPASSALRHSQRLSRREALRQRGGFFFFFTYQ